MTEATKRRGLIFWVLVLAGTVIVLFVGSAVVAGFFDAKARQHTRDSALKLSSINDLQQMVKAGLKRDRRTPLACWYLGAIAFRLAEARDLKIDLESAVDLANDEYLVGELAKNGFNARHVISGVARMVYDSPLPPQKSFESQAESCARGRP